MSDRESLDAAEPRAAEEPTCPLCGTRIAHPWEPGGTVLCHPERGGCGAVVRPRPYQPAMPEADDGWVGE